MNPLLTLKSLGQSPWLDYIQRDLLTGGKLQAMIRDDGISGVTSNPSIFAKAITTHDDYREAIAALRADAPNVETLYERLVLKDIRMAADQLRPLYRSSGKVDGYVSLEVSPALADDAEATIQEALRLWAAIDRPNAMIKVPATLPGLDAIRELAIRGVNVNATLIFSPRRYAAVASAWREGLAQRLDNGDDISSLASVASFFVSRIETLADKLLAEKGDSRLQGKIAVAAAKVAYQTFKKIMQSDDWEDLQRRGALPQRLLWASTSTKNPAYSDIKYVDELVAAQTVNTLPPATLEAYRDHGDPAVRIETGLDRAEAALAALSDLGIDYEQMADQLEREGVEKFRNAYTRLLEALA